VAIRRNHGRLESVANSYRRRIYAGKFLDEGGDFGPEKGRGENDQNRGARDESADDEERRGGPVEP